MNLYQLGRLKNKTQQQQNKTNLNKLKKNENVCIDWRLATKNEPIPFSQFRHQFNRVTVSFIPNFVVHRKPRWWRSNSLIRPKNMGTSVSFLYSIHYVYSKICTISHEEIVSPREK